MPTADTTYYLNTALQSLQSAYACNRDLAVATHLSKAMDALQRLSHEVRNTTRSYRQTAHDPYEMDSSNSAI